MSFHIGNVVEDKGCRNVVDGKGCGSREDVPTALLSSANIRARWGTSSNYGNFQLSGVRRQLRGSLQHQGRV
jgi:hypothetical protein